MKKLLAFLKNTLLLVLPLVLALGLMAGVMSCAAEVKPLDTTADLTGFITEIHQGQDKTSSNQVMVESHADKILSLYSITVKNETPLFKQEGNNFNKIIFADLEVKQWVKIWFSGPVMESWPMQATAKQIVIIEGNP